MSVQIFVALIVGFFLGAATGMTVLVNSRRLEQKALRAVGELGFNLAMKASTALERMYQNDIVLYQDGSITKRDDVFGRIYIEYVKRTGDKILDYMCWNPNLDVIRFTDFTELDDLKESLIHLFVEWNIIKHHAGTDQWNIHLKALLEAYKEDVAHYVNENKDSYECRRI